MIAISTGFVLVTMLAGVLACAAAMWQARAAPQLALASAKTQGRKSRSASWGTDPDAVKSGKDVGGLLTLFRHHDGQGHVEPLRAPSWPGFLSYPLQTRSFRLDDEEEGKADDEELEAKPRRGVDDQVFNDCLGSFDACGDRERALALKVALLSRYPGHRGAVSRAFREIYS